jgi:ferredoxin
LKRLYSSTSATFDDTKEKKFNTVSITYLEADGTSKTVDADIGTDLMTTAHENDIELEGACGGELACSTCHLIFEQDVYDSLPEKDDEEDDMLDLAFEVTDTSRLGCQIIVQENFDGMTVKIPDDGF